MKLSLKDMLAIMQSVLAVKVLAGMIAAPLIVKYKEGKSLPLLTNHTGSLLRQQPRGLFVTYMTIGMQHSAFAGACVPALTLAASPVMLRL